MGAHGEIGPHRARDVAEFLGLLRRLKERSALTGRQLEERAAQHGEVLPRGTLSALLDGGSLPRHELLAAFVRACGDGERLTDWLEARDRLAAPPGGPDDSAETSADASADGNRNADGIPPLVRRARRLLDARTWTAPVAVAASALLVSTVWLLASGSSSGGTDSGQRRENVPDGTVRLRPAEAPRLCLTMGHLRDGRRYGSPVAVQRPCDRAAGPRTVLRPARGEGAYRIEWRGPGPGTGCLTVLTRGPGSGLLEPRGACGRASLFRPEADGRDGEGTYVLHVGAGRCVGVRGPAAAEGSEAVAERCSGARTQRFRIDAVP